MPLADILTRSNLALIIVLLSFLALTLILSTAIPLGEAPDEPAHASYSRFIAEHGRPPVTWDERDAVGYRAKWPPLYQGLAALIIHLTETDGPRQLRGLSIDSTRLLALDGFSGMSFLHTDDEARPYRGIFRSWHAARVLSAILGAGTLILIYLAFRRHFPHWLTLSAIIFVSLIPEFVRMSAVMNDDGLLGFLAVLYVWILWPLFEHPGSLTRYFILGVVAGLALMTKYSTLFLPVSLIWLHLLLKRRFTLGQLSLFIIGYGLSTVWWFAFVTYYFNQIETFGWVKGFIAPFLAGGSDLTTRQIATAIGVDSVFGPSINLFAASWGDWLQTFFTTIWFPTVDGRAWLGWIMAGVAVIGGLGILRVLSDGQGFSRRVIKESETSAVCALNGPQPQLLKPMIWFCLGYLVLFLPLPLLRFTLSQSIAETAQGRHILFPALLPIAFLLTVGLYVWFRDRTALALIGVASFFAFVLPIFIWPRLTFAETPYLPVKSTLDVTPDISLDAEYAAEIALIGVSQLDVADSVAVPVLLIWRALQAPSIDYTYRLILLDAEDDVVGIWQGQPVNGRYPTRAWDAGDVVYDTVWIPTLPDTTGELMLRLDVFDDHGNTIVSNNERDALLQLPKAVKVPSLSGRLTTDRQFEGSDGRVLLTPRGDRRAKTDIYRHRNTISFVISRLSDDAQLSLRDPFGQQYLPTDLIHDETATIVLFVVDWHWDSGQYDLVSLNPNDQADFILENAIHIANNHRLREPPLISRPVEANFNDQFQLLGYDLPINRVESGSHFPITLYWESLRITNMSYTLFNHLLDASQTQYGGQDRVPKGFYSTILWNPGEIVIDRYDVPISQDAPDGIYWLDVGFYPTGDVTAAPLPLVQAGQPLDKNSIRLGPLKVDGQPALSMSTMPPQQDTDFRFGELIVMDGFSMALSNNQQHLDLALYWSPITIPPIDYTVFIHVVDEDGIIVTQADGPPVGGLYPTAFWDIGEQIFDQRQITLADLSAGQYTLRLGWYDPTSGQRLIVPDNADGFIELITFVLE